MSEYFSYNNGEITWIKSPRARVRVGDRAGHVSHTTGRVLVWIKGVSLYRSHIVWALHYMQWPAGILDHINRDPSDDRIENLRAATCSENNRNRSGVAGIRARKHGYQAHIYWHGKDMHLGLYDSVEEATEVRRLWEKMLFTNFAPH